MSDQEAVLTRHRRDIGDRSEGDEVQVPFQVGFGTHGEEPFVTQDFPDGNGEVEGDPHPGDLLCRKGGVREMGIQHRNGRGELSIGEVVVGNDQVDPQAAAGAGRFH